VEALINNRILRWARERAQIDTEAAARSITAKPERFSAWEEGAEFPSLNQARKIADRLRIPFGYLFLSEPPIEDLPIPDLRTRGDHPPDRISADLIDQLSLTYSKQRWYRDYRIGVGADAASYVGKYMIRDNVSEIAADMRTTLGLPDLQFAARSWNDFLTEFVRAVETSGTMVMRSGVVGNNSRRPLQVSEFQGFAIADPFAPLIFINSKDFVAARIFTLAHELAHIWLGESGISLVDVEKAESGIDLERFCNAIAVEVLVPLVEFTRAWGQIEDIEAGLNHLARRYRVSSIVVLRRAFEANIISRDTFFELLGVERRRQTPLQPGTGGSQINNIVARNGRIFSEALVSSTFEGTATFDDATRLLGVKVKTLKTLASEFGIQ